MCLEMKPKYSIGVRHTERELYRIFKDLEKHGRTTFNYTDRTKQQGIARTIGIRGKSLIERDLFLPPARTRDQRMNIVALPIGVTIKEKKKGRFFFQREDNIL